MPLIRQVTMLDLHGRSISSRTCGCYLGYVLCGPVLLGTVLFVSIVYCLARVLSTLRRPPTAAVARQVGRFLRMGSAFRILPGGPDSGSAAEGEHGCCSLQRGALRRQSMARQAAGRGDYGSGLASTPTPWRSGCLTVVWPRHGRTGTNEARPPVVDAPAAQRPQPTGIAPAPGRRSARRSRRSC